jgi:putative tryptophan/tyrosine transport system substrate-binding protein
MRRRHVLIGLGTAPLVPIAAAQQPRPVVAILSPASPRNETAMRGVNRPFKEALKKLGYETGHNIDIVERFAEGDESRLPALAAELVALQPQVLFTNTSYAATVAARATRTIPIVVGPAGETVLRELAGGSLARPTTNVTGFAIGIAGSDDKCISLLMEAAPAAKRIGVLINPRNPGQASHPASPLEGALSVRGKTLIRLESTGLGDIDAALAKTAAERIAALYVADDAQIAGDPEVRRRVLRFAAAAGMPVASSRQDYAHEGALLTMGPSLPVLAARAAGYVDKILRGARPSDLPIELPTVVSVTLNLKTAKALGLNIAQALLLRADEVIA